MSRLSSLQKFIPMLQKTQTTEQTTTIAESSFTAALPRIMYTESNLPHPSHINNSEGEPSHPNNLIVFSATSVSALVWPELFFLDEQIKVSLRGNYYNIRLRRTEEKHICRNGEVNGEIVHFFSQKIGKKIAAYYLQRYLKGKDLWVHLNVLIYELETQMWTSQDYHLKSVTADGKLWDLSAIQMINYCKQAVLVVKIIGKQLNTSKLLLLDLAQKGKGGKEGKSIITVPEGLVLAETDLQFEYKSAGSEQRLLRLLKSEYGDVLILCTTEHIYEVEVDGPSWRIEIKVINFWHLAQQNQPPKSQFKHDKPVYIRDVQFMSNGLKMMVLTSRNSIVLIEAKNYLFSCDIQEQIANECPENNQMQKDVSYVQLRAVNGSVVIIYESHAPISEKGSTMGIITLKFSAKGVNIKKIIALPFTRQELTVMAIHQCPKYEEVYIQHMQKKGNVLTVLKCKLLMPELHALELIEQHQCTGSYFSGADVPQLYHPYPEAPLRFKKCHVSSTSKVVFLLTEKELCCYLLSSQRDGPTKKLYTQCFFERPLRVVVSPVTNHFVVVFKEFLRFFHFNYFEAKSYFSLKMKNVGAVTYSPSGEVLLLGCADGTLHFLHSYSLKEEQIGEVHGEILDAIVLDVNRIIVRTSKGVLQYLKRSDSHFTRVLDIRVDEGDIYTFADNAIVIPRANGWIEVHSLQNMRPIRRFLGISDINGMLINTTFGIMLLYSPLGSIRQYYWPLEEAEVLQVFKQDVGHRAILGVQFDSKLTSLSVVCEDGVMIQLECEQYVGGAKMPYVYGIIQRTPEWVKWEFVDKSCVLDEFIPIENQSGEQLSRQHEELEFILDKVKGDLEDLSKSFKQIDDQKESISAEYNKTEASLRAEWSVEYEEMKKEYNRLHSELSFAGRETEETKKAEIKQYEDAILKLYREKERLRRLQSEQEEELSHEREALRGEHARIYLELLRSKEAELTAMELEYESADANKCQFQGLLTLASEEEVEIMKRETVELQRENEATLQHMEGRKENCLGSITRLNKEIKNYKKRADGFESVIMETRVQISNMRADGEEYQRKKEHLSAELKGIQERILRLENQLVSYLKNTEAMKVAKITHQFQLEEAEKEVLPIHEDYEKLQKDVQQMNQEIMVAYSRKLINISSLEQAEARLKELKSQKQTLISQKAIVANKLHRLLESISAINVYSPDAHQAITALVEKQPVQGEEDRQAGQKAFAKALQLMRSKAMTKKEIEVQQKREDHLQKNQHQFFKHHIENTELVRQVNELRKTHTELSNRQNTILKRLAAVRQEVGARQSRSRLNSSQKGTPSKQIRSVSKLTPFQRYENEQNKCTVETRVSDSTELLKGLLKEVGRGDKLDKMQIIRERIRSFVNPEMKGKVLFGRSRMQSQALRL